MSDQQLIELFKSGNFTIVYWDNTVPSIYKGKWDINQESEKDDYEEMNKHEVDFNDWGDGYCPKIVELLAEALGGKSDSI